MVVAEAKRRWPDMPLVVRSQKKHEWPAGTETLPATKDNSDLYSSGDVLLLPHSVDGIGLEVLEAMSCGMPVIATDGRPWQEHPLFATIPATSRRRKVKRMVDWYSPDVNAMIGVCKSVLGQDLSHASLRARKYAEQRAWSDKNREFQQLIA